MSNINSSVASALKGVPLGGYVQNTATNSLNQGVAETVDRVKGIIDDIISNFDLNRLLDIAKRSLDWHTYINLAPSPRSQDLDSYKEPTSKRGKFRQFIDTGVNILFEINEQYPTQLKALVVVFFILTPLGTAFILLVSQGWDTSW